MPTLSRPIRDTSPETRNASHGIKPEPIGDSTVLLVEHREQGAGKIPCGWQRRVRRWTANEVLEGSLLLLGARWYVSNIGSRARRGGGRRGG